MKIRFGLLLLLILLYPISGCFSQHKLTLSHEDYADWNVISNTNLSPDGSWLLYELNPQDGDGLLVIRHLESNREEHIPRGYRATVSPDGNYAAFHIKPQQAVLRQAKVEKKKRNETPIDSLGIFIFDAWKYTKYPALVSYSFPREASDWMTYVVDNAMLEFLGKELEKDKQEPVIEEEESENPQPESEEEIGSENEDSEEKKKEKPGKSLHLYNPISGERIEIPRISDHVLSDFGTVVAGLTEKEEKDTLSLWEAFVIETESLDPKIIDSRYGEMKQLNIDINGQQLVWLFSSDTTDTKTFLLVHYDLEQDRIHELSDRLTSGMPEGYGISEHRKPYFSDNGQRLFFGTAPLLVVQDEDTLLREEKYSLDIWHWEDPMLQSQQKAQLRQLQQRNYLAVYYPGQSNLVQLGDEDLSVIQLNETRNSAYALGQNPEPYLIERQWTGGNSRDLYAVSVSDGARYMIADRVESTASISPGGNYIVWYDISEPGWKAYSLSGKFTVSLTDGIDVAFYNEENDQPTFARPYGIAGWATDDQAVLIYDRFDIWLADPTGANPLVNITSGFGREHNTRLRIQNLDRDDYFIRLDEKLLLSAFNERTMQSGFFSLHNQRLEMLIMDDASFSGLQKSKHAEKYLFRKSTFLEYPDVWICDETFRNPQKVSEANPQQSEYNWGSVQLVEWLDFKNEPLKGLLYLPDNLDASKKYPMLVYFYERSSQGLHSHSIPSPSRSTINRPYCTSNGYIVFVPDITYEIGFPGESAYNAIISGTKAMVERYPFIDRERMGLQGQSWGGYQIAYLVTRTNLFKAAMAGAPVSNMVSAYGGIRWQTGLNRQFQYEQTQSRIGGTLWEKPLRYIENSPIFFADKIETPLLMMHNDDDGAVPWYQGIELFTAMRRLSKPVWMLVYNGEAHNLTKWPNRMDLSVRMYQFFDHYLKDEPAPIWLKRGIPATEKGKTHGYELTE